MTATTSSSLFSTSLGPTSSSTSPSSGPDALSIDSFLTSLPLASLQLLDYCCRNQSTGSSHLQSTSYDGLSTESSTTPPRCQWPTSPTILCDRFYANSLANLTSSAVHFLDTGQEAPGPSSLWSAGNGMLFDDDEDASYLTPNLRILLTIFLSLMIISTVIGNILVCLSVILVRKLRHPSNYLLVSLAISDLCVAILVMPLALQYELNQSWILSHAICDLWVSFDVTCCTSSILNLCTISIDRYLAITKPLTYGVRRTTKRILSFIAAVWIASCLISIPPVLLLGNEYGSNEAPTCEVSQNIGYQLYATLGAFYIPLSVMIFMYYKIYVAAKRVVDAELRDQRPSCSSATSQCVSLLKSCSVNSTVPPSLPATATALSTENAQLYPNLVQLSAGGATSKLYPALESTETELAVSNHHSCSNSTKKSSTKAKKSSKRKDSEQRKVERMLSVIKRDRKEAAASTKTVKSGCCCACLSAGSSTKSSNSSLPAITEQPNSLTVPTKAGNGAASSNLMLNLKDPPILTRHHGGQHHHHHLNHHSLNHHSLNHGGVHIQHHRLKKSSSERSSIATVNYKRRASNALRERKASFTLGIIMTAFTVCWLPFFILALLRPFSSSIVEIPRFVSSMALWLGYANSMLNPIIYVTFHQDFRRAFKYLLCLQCSTMGSRLRAEAYKSQYGGSLGHLNGAGSNGTSNGKGKGSGGATAAAAKTLRANASWSQLDDKIVHSERPISRTAYPAQTALQSSSTVPLLTGTGGPEEEDGPMVHLPPLREYELQSITTNGTVGASGPGGGLPVSLLLTTTFALTNTTTTTSARIAVPSGTSPEPELNIQSPIDAEPSAEPVTAEYPVDHPNSIDTGDYSHISIQIDPTNHQATITRNSIA